MSSDLQPQSYRAIFDAINDALFIHDAATGAILDVNDAMLSMYGYGRDEIAHLTIGDLSAGYPPFSHSHALEHIQAVLSSGPQLFEWRARKKNGDLFWVEVSLSCAHVPDGQRVLAVVRDTTERKKAEELYKETQRLLNFTQFTVHQAKIAVFWCHATGFFFYVNDTACEWLQYSREELMSMHVADINPEFPREAWAAHWQEIKDHGMVFMQSIHRRKNGEVYPVEIYSNFVQFEGVDYKLAFVHDITAQKQAEAEKAALEDRLRQSQKMEAIGTLAGGVAHDFNNMLSPILGYAELLQQDLSADHPHWAKLNEIFKAGVRARDLTRQLLTFGRKHPLEVRSLDLNEVVTIFEKMLRRTIRENIEIENRLAPSLPPLSGDAGQIELVILNLALNAQDAMPDGGVLTIETGQEYLDEKFPEFQAGGKPGTYIMMAVSDTGYGMTQEISQRVFEPFFTTKEKGQGTGLGLSTAYGIVKQHGGYLWVYSEPGQGTTFKVFFPQSEKPVEDIRPPERKPAPAQGQETVLIVEDQEQVLMLAKEILDACGYNVLDAGDGQTAIRIARSYDRPIDLLLTDLVMPDMNGRELYKRLAAILPDVKVLYMSGYTDDVIIHHGIADKGINFISKPFGVQDLADKVRASLDR